MKSLEYAYPGSLTALDLGFKEGCWIVWKDIYIDLEPVMFDNKLGKQALEFFESIQMPASPYSLTRLSLCFDYLRP